ncbi:MAG TPA: LytTR family DNA-binding domain-containing protein [Bacteroidales bacterium]
MAINCIIIEDEPLAMEKLAGFIGELPFLKLIQTFDNGIDAIGFVKTNPVDLIFLDIQMYKFTGIQFLETLTERPQVIIVSAYDRYALKGYEFSVTDYLLKPYSFDRFVQAIDKVMEKQKSKTVPPPHVHNDIIFVKTEYCIERINIEDILYIQGMKDYQMIVTTHDKIMTLQNFREIENVLPTPAFIRIHKSYIVSLNKIESIERNRIKIAGQLLPISDTYKDVFYDTLRNSKNLI